MMTLIIVTKDTIGSNQFAKKEVGDINGNNR
jgi:hypothetical protein